MTPFNVLRMRNPSADGGSAVAPTYGAVGTHNAGSLAAAYPAGISAGDLLLLTVVCNAATGVDTRSYTASGFTLIQRHYVDEGAGAGTILTLFYAVATGSESGTITPVGSGGTANREGAIVERISGVNTSGTPYESVQTYTRNTTDTGGGTFSTSAITTAANGRLLRNVFGCTFGAETFTSGAGWTESYDFARNGVGPDYWFGATHRAASGFGAQSAETITLAFASVYVVGISFALKGV